MSEQSKGNMQLVGAAVMGFVAVVGLAGLVLTHDSGRGSLWSAARARADSARSASGLSAPVSSGSKRAGSSFGEAPVSESSPAPLVGSLADEESSRAAAPASAGGSAAASASADARTGPSHLQPSTLGPTRYAGNGSETSSARAQAAAAPGSQPDAAAAPAKAGLRPKLARTNGGIVSAVHYGVTSRSELMGRAAGPVYNFAGRTTADHGGLGRLTGEAGQKVAEAQKKVEESPLTPEQKQEAQGRLAGAQQVLDSEKR